MAWLVRVLPDTSVCFPISLLDLILRCDEADLHRTVWTEDLLAELARVWVEKGARNAKSAHRICDQIRDAFPQQEVLRSSYASLIATMPGPDPDDHVHAAAAVSVAPSALLTANLRDFPAAALAEHGVDVEHPDSYFAALLDAHTDDLSLVIEEMAESRRHPSMTPIEVLDALERAGLRVFASRARRSVRFTF